MLIAALTGDLIRSRTAAPDAVEVSMTALRDTALALGASCGFDPHFTRHRGDGWQAVMPLPGPLLSLPLGLTAGLTAAQTGLDTRIAIAVGPAESLGTHDLSDAAGAAFVTSGDVLDSIDGRTGRRMAAAGPSATQWLSAVVEMADWIAQGWTQGQAEAALCALLRPGTTNAEHAQALNISRQSFERRLRGSGLSAMQEARDAVALHDWTAA
ncbi:MAG: hypothetical protein AAGM84_03590 [Pseudomonadota bacterium]